MPPKLGEATLPFQVDLSVPGGHQEASITVVFPRGWGARRGGGQGFCRGQECRQVGTRSLF